MKTGSKTSTRPSFDALLIALLAGTAACAAPGNSGENSSVDSRGELLSDRPWYVARTVPVDAEEDALQLVVRPGRQELPPGRAFDLPIVIDVQAPASQLERPPLAISLIFDKSGSMREAGKLEYTVQAAKLLIDNLSEKDTVSIVTFGDESTVLVPQQPVTRKLFLSHWADEIEPHGYTNLSAGLLAGLEQIRSSSPPGAVARAILLTDGKANRGVITPKKLRKLTKAARKSGITVSTIGVGQNFDEDVLAGLAQAGGGHYSFVPDPEVIPAAVAGEIQGLLPVIHQNVSLSLKLPEGIARGRRIICGRPEDTNRAESRSSDGRVSLELGDFVPGERKTVVLWLRFPSLLGASPPLVILNTSLSSRLTGDDGRRVSQEQELRLSVASSIENSEATVDMPAMDCALLAEIFELTYTAIKSHDDDLIEEALRTIREYRSEFEAIAARNDGIGYPGHAELVAHYGEELLEIRGAGEGHGHEEASQKLEKDLHYRRYLLLHHNSTDGSVRDPAGVGTP